MLGSPVYFEAITRGLASEERSVEEALKKSYMENVTDEYIKPCLLDKNGLIKNGDNIMWMNYREDRAVQLLEALSNPDFEAFRKIDTTSCNVYTFLPFEKPINIILKRSEYIAISDFHVRITIEDK